MLGYIVLAISASSILGLAVWLLNEKIESLSLILLAFASGNFLYIALTDLIPITHQDKRIQKVFGHFLVLLTGLAVMYWAGNIISHSH